MKFTRSYVLILLEVICLAGCAHVDHWEEYQHKTAVAYANREQCMSMIKEFMGSHFRQTKGDDVRAEEYCKQQFKMPEPPPEEQ